MNRDFINRLDTFNANRRDMRDKFFKAFPNPNSKERETWRNLTKYSANIEDDFYIKNATDTHPDSIVRQEKILQSLVEKMFKKLNT